MNKICTSIEQSQRLIELGIDMSTADMCYLKENGQPKAISPLKLSEILNVSKPQVIPAWSLSALFSMLPKSSRLERGSSSELCCVNLPVELKCSDWYLDPIDAAFEMVVWLLKNYNNL